MLSKAIDEIDIVFFFIRKRVQKHATLPTCVIVVTIVFQSTLLRCLCFALSAMVLFNVIFYAGKKP